MKANVVRQFKTQGGLGHIVSTQYLTSYYISVEGLVRVRFIGHPDWVNAENHLFQVRLKGMNCRFYISPPHSSKSALTADAVCQDETGGTYWGSCNEH